MGRGGDVAYDGWMRFDPDNCETWPELAEWVRVRASVRFHPLDAWRDHDGDIFTATGLDRNLSSAAHVGVLLWHPLPQDRTEPEPS
jgi:hypothetical protein